MSEIEQANGIEIPAEVIEAMRWPFAEWHGGRLTIDEAQEKALRAALDAWGARPNVHAWTICRDCCEAWPTEEPDQRCDCEQDHRFQVLETPWREVP